MFIFIIHGFVYSLVICFGFSLGIVYASYARYFKGKSAGSGVERFCTLSCMWKVLLFGFVVYMAIFLRFFSFFDISLSDFYRE